jgi:diacylglycerol O-acyltransferase
VRANRAHRGHIPGRESPPIDRLTAPDLMLVWPEEKGWPQDIGALGVLDGRALLDADGRLRIEAARERIERRLHLVPRFRQLLYWPRAGLGWPMWVDAPSFDVAEHVGVFPVQAPGDETQLLLACEKLRRRPMSRSRPLWEMWFLTGLQDGRIGFFMRMHHAIADGVAGVATLAAFVDPVPDPPELQAPRWTPLPTPSDRQLFQDNLRRRLGELHRALSALAEPVSTVRRIQRAWPATREIFAEGRAPRISLNRRPIGSDRRLAVLRSRLDLAKAIAHAHVATVNDVLLTAVAGGYAELLRGRGECVDGLVLRAFVPVSLHREQPGQARGNVDAGMLVPLPVGEADDLGRLRLIARETAVRKKKSRPPAGSLFRTVLGKVKMWSR